MHKGSCLCGRVEYKIDCEPEVVGSCHCTMCQKQHGAAFATYVSMDKRHFSYTKGESELTAYNSSGAVQRKFCSTCGSNIEWSGSPECPDWISVPLATFDSILEPSIIEDYHLGSKCKWLINH